MTIRIGTLTWSQAPPANPTFHSASASGVQSGGVITVAAPAGITAGDLLVAHILRVSSVTPPAGWTAAFTDFAGNACAVYVKTATASEPASYAFTVGGTVPAAVVFDIRNGTSVDAAADALASGTSVNAPSVTAANANELWLVSVLNDNSGTFTFPAGFNSASGFVAGGSNRVQGIYHAAPVGPGATGTATITVSSTALIFAISTVIK